MKVKTSELIGPALRYVVAQCAGYAVGVLTAEDVVRQQSEGETDPAQLAWIKQVFGGRPAEPCFVGEDGRKRTASSTLAAETGCGTMEFDTNWAQGGPISEKAGISAIYHDGREVWSAFRYRPRPWHERPEDSHEDEQEGLTELVAKLRCLVAIKFGLEVDVPEELLPCAAPITPKPKHQKP